MANPKPTKSFDGLFRIPLRVEHRLSPGQIAAAWYSHRTYGRDDWEDKEKRNWILGKAEQCSAKSVVEALKNYGYSHDFDFFDYIPDEDELKPLIEIMRRKFNFPAEKS